MVYMKKRPLVTISIPTLNSEKYIKRCISAIRTQNYKNIEINIVDGGSKDLTLEVARDMGVENIYIDKKSLLSARYCGVMNAKGKYVLLLDSDQIIEKDTIDNAIKCLEKNHNKMLILGEDVYSDKTFLEHLIKLDKKLIHLVKDIDPYTSVLLPRFFDRKFLVKVFKRVPRPVIEEARPQDHAIIYLESWLLDKNVGVIDNCIKHIEPRTFLQFFNKFYRWGYGSITKHHSKYDQFFKERTERLRNGMLKDGMIKESLASVFLLIIKGISYHLGYIQAKLDCYFNKVLNK